jgi:hypothetical protein
LPYDQSLPNTQIFPTKLKPLLYPRHNNRPIRQQNDKEHILDWSFDRVRETNHPKWNRGCPKFLSLQHANLYVGKGRHEVGGGFSRFLFSYSVGRILCAAFKNVFQRADTLSRATDIAGIASKRVSRIVGR